MSREVIEAIELALALEQEEVDYYRLASDKTEDASGKKVFTYLAQEEEEHIKALKKQVESFEGKGSWLTDEEAFDKRICRTLSKKKPAGILPTEISPDADDVDALTQAIEIEGKSIEFYEDAACNTKDEAALKMFHYLIDAERQHHKELKMQLTFLETQGIWYDVDVILS